MGQRHRFRDRLVLGPIIRYLHGGEEILAWSHANVPEVRAPGVLVVTNHHCLLHVASSTIPDISTPLTQLSGFKLDRRDPEVVRVRLHGEGHEVDVELSLTNRVRSRSVGRVLSALTRHQVVGPDSFDPLLSQPLPPMVRNVRHHARRVWITVVGVLVLLVSLVFASPFVPGPGALTALAGIAILAREYEWARDVHVWAARQVDRFITWVRRVRAGPKDRPSRSADGSAPRGEALEAVVPAPENDPPDGDDDRGVLAS